MRKFRVLTDFKMSGFTAKAGNIILEDRQHNGLVLVYSTGDNELHTANSSIPGDDLTKCIHEMVCYEEIEEITW